METFINQVKIAASNVFAIHIFGVEFEVKIPQIFKVKYLKYSKQNTSNVQSKTPQIFKVYLRNPLNVPIFVQNL